MDQVARVVLALEEHDVAEEVMHFLDRSGVARVVASAGDDRQLAEAAGATVAPDVAPDSRATIVAVHGPRGGAGCTFVATHLAAAFARRGDCVLVDADVAYGDVGPAIGAPSDDVHSSADLVPLLEERAAPRVDDALWSHPAGFRVLLAPPAEAVDAVDASAIARLVAAAAGGADTVIVHLPRALGPTAAAVVPTADRVLEVVSLDVLSFRAARRAIDAFGRFGLPDGRVGIVVNRAARAEITPSDVTRVFGVEPLGVLPVHRSVPRAQDHGTLLPARGRMGRAFDRLATRVLEPG